MDLADHELGLDPVVGGDERQLGQLIIGDDIEDGDIVGNLEAEFEEGGPDDDVLEEAVDDDGGGLRLAEGADEFLAALVGSLGWR